MLLDESEHIRALVIQAIKAKLPEVRQVTDVRHVKVAGCYTATCHRWSTKDRAMQPFALAQVRGIPGSFKVELRGAVKPKTAG